VKHRILFAVAACLGACLSGCVSQESSPTALTAPAAEDPPDVVIDPGAGFHTLLDDTRIRKFAVEGNLLTMDLEFSGGCREHEFEAITNGGFLESLPPQLRVFVRHDANEDPCDALVRERVAFDLTPIAELIKESLADDLAGPIILLLVEASDRETAVEYDPE
jgi:hypothetical protein